MRSRAQDPPALDDSPPGPGVEQQRAASPSPAASLSSSSVRSKPPTEAEELASNAASSRSPSPNVAAVASSAPASLISTASAPPTIVISPPPSTPASIQIPPRSPSPDGSIHRYSRSRENNRAFIAEESRGVRSRKSMDESSESRAWSSNSPTKVRSPQRRLSPTKGPLGKQDDAREMVSRSRTRRSQSPWSCSWLTIFVTFVAAAFGILIMRSFLHRLFDFDPKGCAMSMMRPAFAKFSDFDTEHTRFASKYSLYLYREGLIDEDTRVKGVPVLFVPGNAGSYKQVRPLAAQAAVHFKDQLQNRPEALKNGKRPLDFFSVDLNEDITAFHGQTMLDQAEYLNEAVQYILSLYHNPNRALRDPDLPDPSSVIIVGHSMGGVVARTMLTMPNYQANTVNTILTLAAPHARAPVSFDSDIITTYNKINDYWRKSYSEKWANNNPLWHVTLISISGGGLDTVVPSDYAALSSIVPPTHGFTVFTSTIPTVWTSMDHLAITWCDQLRKSIVPALYDVIDVSRSTQTRPRAERMSVFKKAFLTGMESIAEKSLPHQEPKSLLTLEDESNKMLSQGDKLIIKGFEGAPKPKAYIMPIPPADSRDQKRFTLLTDRKLNAPNTDVEVMFCSVFHPNVGSASSVFAMDIQMAGNNNSSGSTRLACKDAGNDITLLPASTHSSKYPFDQKEPFSYLQYGLEQLSEHQFVAVVDRGFHSRRGFLVAEFSAVSDSDVVVNDSLRTLLVSGTTVSFPSNRPMMTSIQIPSVQSSLLTYKLSIARPFCLDGWETFSPILRQYISEPYESKYFVNVKTADIALHGVAPYLPQPLRQSSSDRGLTLQVWSYPLCEGGMDISLKIDAIGSLGKLWMRYRTVFAAFPLLVVAIVLRKQFKIYDQSGVFISFAEATDHCIRTSVPMLVLALTLFAMSTSKQSAQQSSQAMQDMLGLKANVTDSLLDFSKNDLLLGSPDPFFWFLLPLFALLSVGICIAVNYTLLTIIHLISITCTRISRFISNPADPPRNNHNVFVVSSLQKRIITTGILLLFVSTLIPYQFVFIVLCLVQMATCVRALGLARETNAKANINFFNYAYSILLLMLWILPINVPTLIVWVHNLAVHWLTPFSSHHNILSIMPFVFVVEMLSTGKMVPRVMSWFIAQATSLLLFAVACGAAIYGVSYAYLLHSWVNLVFGWLTILHMSSSDRIDWKAIRSSLGIAEGEPAVVAAERVRRGGDIKKRP